MNGDQTSWRSLMLADEVAVSGGVPFPYTADQYFKDDVGEVSFESVYDSFSKQSDEPSSAASINNRCLLVRKLSDALQEACESETQVIKSALLVTAPDSQKFSEFQTFSSREDETSAQTKETKQKVEFCIGDNAESERSGSQLQATDSSGSSRHPPMSSVELVELFFHLSADDDSAVRAESLDSLPSFLEAFKRGWPQIDAALQRRPIRKLNTNGYYRLVLANGSGSELDRNGRRGAEPETEGEVEAEARLGSGALFVPIVVHGLRDESNEQVRKNALAALERIAERRLFPARSPAVERQLLEALVEPLRRKSAFEMPPLCNGPVGVRRMSSRSSPTLASAVDNDESIRIGSLKLIGKLTECGLVSNSALRRHFEDAFKRACSDASMAVRRQCASLFGVFSCLLDTGDDHGTRSHLETDVHSEDDVFDGDGDVQGCGCSRQRRNATCRSRKTESFKSGSDALGVCMGVASSTDSMRPSLLDSFVALCADSNWQVRRECAVAFVAVAQRVAVSVRRTSLTRAFVRLLDDTTAYNRCVQQAAYAHLGTFISMMTDDAECDSHAECDATEDANCEQMVVNDADKLRGTNGVDPSALMLLLSATDECAFDLLAQRLQLGRKVHGFELLPGNDDSGDPFSCTSPAVDTWPNAVSSATTSQTPTPTPTSRASQSGSGSPRSRPSQHFLFDLVRYEQLRTYLCLPPPFTLADVLAAAGTEYERTVTDLLARAARFPLLARSAVLCDASSSASNAQCLYDCVPTAPSVSTDADQFQSVPVTFDCAPQCGDSAMRELQCQVDVSSDADADADADATQQLNANSGAQAQHSVTFEQRFKALLHCLLADASDVDPVETETLVDADDDYDSSGRYALISGVPRVLIEYFVGMLDAERNESSANNPAESDLIRHCAETLPNVVRALTASTCRSASGASTWPRCRLLLFALACSANWRVRRTVAQSLAELARCVGESYASRDLLAVFAEFVRENLDEVKAGLAECLAALISLVNANARRELLSRVSHLFTQENARNWRVRRGLLAQLARLASDRLIPLNAFVDSPAPPEVHGETPFRFADTGFSPMQLLRDAVYEVRVAAFHLVAALLELAAPSDTDANVSSSTDFYNALLRSAQLLVFEQTANGERRLNGSYRDRQSYVQLVAVVCDRGTLLTPGRGLLVNDLLAPALALANDRIVNVRISLADLLANANLLAFFSTSCACVYPDAVLAAYRTLLADPSVDVRDLVAGAIASQASLLSALAFAAGPQPATSTD